MTNVSNMYAAKLYSEHPIAIWPIDDDFPYISLITDQQRTFEADSPYAGWTITNGTANDSITLPDIGSPFDSDIYAGIVGDVPSVSETYIEAKSPDIFLFSDCSQDLKTFCISMYIYQSSTYVSEYEVGYEYYDDGTSSWIQEYSVVVASDRRGWIHIQDTFTIHQFDSDYCHIVFRAKVNSGGVSGDYDFIFNGITVGQWSEPFTSKSLGISSEYAPVSSNLTDKVVPSDQYGILSDNAYFVCENGKPLAKNQGIPMVFGSENVTKIYPSLNGVPSFIFPNKNFFTKNGVSKDYTLEFWLRIKPSTKESRKIVGPIDNADGIYVSEGFITLVVDGKFKSHNISHWYRPMVVHIYIKDDTFSMLINGEEVAQIKIDKNTVSLSESEWMGFYSYEDIDIMEIDCVSIFPYAIPLQVARKRFVWGQGTDPLELINDSFDGEEAIINFSNANYTVNKVYPDMERWDAGYYNNLIATTNSISVPQYSLPEIYLGGRDISEWYSDNKIVNDAAYPSGNHPKFTTFRPNKGTRSNIFPNPSFETDITSWVPDTSTGGSTTLTRITTDSYSGSSCLKISSPFSSIGVETSIISVTPSQTYTFSAYVKSVVGMTEDEFDLYPPPTYDTYFGWIACQILYSRSSDGLSYGTEQNFKIVEGSDWTRINVSASLPAGFDQIQLKVVQGGAAGSREIRLDAVLLEQTSLLRPYFDGSYADIGANAISYEWTGSENNSSSVLEYWVASASNWTEPCYMNFPSLTFLSNSLSSIYGIFEVEEEVLGKRPLIHIVNTLTGKRFEINITGYNVTYEFDGQELSNTGFTVANNHFSVGFHIPTISQSFNYELSSFFGSPEVLSMLVGGNGISTFEGKIYRIGFSDQINYLSISEHFREDGIINNLDEALLEGHYASYTLSPFFRYNAFFLDISVSSQWEEYFPLSSFASYITGRNGERVYDLDYLQFNFGYPSIISVTGTETDNPDWTYQELFEAYNDPIQKNYSVLDNSILTEYANYADLASNVVTQYEIDVSKSSLDAYVTFQLLAEGADEPLSSFINTKALTDSYTVYADKENTNLDPYRAYKTKFSIIDGTIIYPPKAINFKNVAMVVHFEIEQDGIISNPLKIKNLEITSKSLNQNGLTAIGTKTGTPIYPYTKTGIYYNGKSKNPVMIGKQSLPYLYLTENTGIKILNADSEIEYGSLIPINKNESKGYLLGAFQLFMKYDIFQAIGTTQTIFYLNTRNGGIEFTITPGDTAMRYYISARDKITKRQYSGISFYQNGIKVVNPYIEKYDWNAIAFSFDDPIDMSGFSGSLNLLFGCTYSNISFFKSTGLNEYGITIPRTWSDVLYGDQEIDPLNIVDWQNWYDENGVLSIPNEWKNVYVSEESRQFSTTPKEIYETYMGTNIIVIDDSTGMSVVNDQFSIFSSTVWNEPPYNLKPS